MMKKLFHNYEEYLIGIFLVAISAVAILQVIMRHIFHNSLSWSEEAMRFMFIWLVMLGFSDGVKKNTHIKVTIIYDRLHGLAKYLLGMLVHAVFFVTAGFVFIQSLQNVAAFLRFPQISPALHIPMQLVYLAGPVGFGSTLLRLVERMAGDTKGYLVSKHSGGDAEHNMEGV